MNKKDWTNLGRKELKELPSRKWDEVKSYKEVYLIPSGFKHGSGFMMIAIVGLTEDGSFEVAACPDDINWKYSFIDKYAAYPELGSVRTDCSYPKGIQRYWGKGVKFEVGVALSSTTITVINHE